jgi:HAD superfamily hydrolase (TIGR01509 family)
MSIQVATLDVDGTILDTREFIFRSFEHALAETLHTVPARHTLEKMLLKVSGKPLENCYAAIVPNADVDKLCVAHRAFQSRGFELITPYPGLISVLEALKQNKIRLAALSSRKKTVRDSLEHVGVSQYFDMIIDGDDVSHPKPHPEGLMHILGTLGTASTRAAMIGDTVIDIQTGKSAGVATTIAITHGFEDIVALEKAGADHIVDKLSKIVPILLR